MNGEDRNEKSQTAGNGQKNMQRSILTYSRLTESIGSFWILSGYKTAIKKEGNNETMNAFETSEGTEN